MSFRRLFTFLGVLLGLTLVPAVAEAANFHIDDSVEAQITLTQDANWEFGVDSNGTLFPGFASGSTTAPGESATFSGSWIVNSPGNPDPGTGIIYFLDQVVIGGNAGLVVSDIVMADWSTSSGVATISFRILSSACGQNLGPLPPHFAGQGVPDPANAIEISGLFRDPATAAPVTIPSNLTVQFVGIVDTACPVSEDEDDDDNGQADDDDDDGNGNGQADEDDDDDNGNGQADENDDDDNGHGRGGDDNDNDNDDDDDD